MSSALLAGYNGTLLFVTHRPALCYGLPCSRCGLLSCACVACPSALCGLPSVHYDLPCSAVWPALRTSWPALLCIMTFPSRHCGLPFYSPACPHPHFSQSRCYCCCCCQNHRGIHALLNRRPHLSHAACDKASAFQASLRAGFRKHVSTFQHVGD